jgi:hypothetical protein
MVRKLFRRSLALYTIAVLFLTPKARADDFLSALLESHDQQQDALVHSASGVFANADFASQLQLDKDPTEILAEADLESQEVSSLGASADDPTRPSLAAASTRSRSDASPSSLRLDRGKRSQFGSAVIGINVSGTNQHNVAYLKRRIDELTRWAFASLCCLAGQAVKQVRIHNTRPLWDYLLHPLCYTAVLLVAHLVTATRAFPWDAREVFGRLCRILVQATEGGESNARKQGYPEMVRAGRRLARQCRQGH